MTEEISEFVYVDGVPLHKDDVIKMATNCMNPVVVDHYITFLQYHAFKYRRQDIADKVDEIRAAYHFVPFDSGKAAMSSGKYNPNFNTTTPRDERARKIYKNLNTGDREDVLRSALVRLRLEKEDLFYTKICWAGIYFVVRDRLDGTIKMNNFHAFAVKFTPASWPDDLRIGEHTLRNVNRKVDAKDMKEAYYDMENNPWEELCEKYWSYVLANLLTKE